MSCSDDCKSRVQIVCASCGLGGEVCDCPKEDGDDVRLVCVGCWRHAKDMYNHERNVSLWHQSVLEELRQCLVRDDTMTQGLLGTDEVELTFRCSNKLYEDMVSGMKNKEETNEGLGV